LKNTNFNLNDRSARGAGEPDSEQLKQISILFSKLKSGDVKKQIKAAILLEKTIYNGIKHHCAVNIIAESLFKQRCLARC